MKSYYVNVQANKNFTIKARNQREMRVKARKRLMYSPGHLDIDVLDEVDD